MNELTGTTSQAVVDRLTKPAIVDQASGMISARDRVSCEFACDGLTRYAAAFGQPLEDVCAAVVARSLNPILDHTPRRSRWQAMT